MHARYRSPLTSRFLSTDPAGGDPGAPQSWNRYAYVQGNPLKLVDPDGKNPALVIAAIGFGALGYAGQLYVTEGPASADKFLRQDLPELMSVVAMTEIMGVMTESAMSKLEAFAGGIGTAAAPQGPVRSAGDALSELIQGSTVIRDGKSLQLGRTGGLNAANEQFSAITKSLEVKNQGGGIRSASLPNGTTVSVRPGGGGQSATIQVNERGKKAVKIRYEEPTNKLEP